MYDIPYCANCTLMSVFPHLTPLSLERKSCLFEYINRCGMAVCIQPSLTRQTFCGLLGGDCTIVSVSIHFECTIGNVLL